LEKIGSANSDFFSGRRKVVLQTRIFKTTFFSGWRKVVLQTRIFFFLVGGPEKKSEFEEPLFCHPQITSKGAD
jgi:hypothetical protein